MKEYTAKEMKLFKINSCQDEEIANALQESCFGHMKDEIEVSACKNFREVKLLKANPYTFKVTKNKLYFTAEFKEAFWMAY